MNIIGFSGLAQSGKDTSGAHVINTLGYNHYAFADRIREVLLALDPRVNGTVSVSMLHETTGGDWEAMENHRVYGPELRRAIDVFFQVIARDTFDDGQRSQDDLREDLLVLDPFLNGGLTMAGLVLDVCKGDWEKAKKHRIHGFETRRIMQVLGTEVVRVNYGGRAWVDFLARKIASDNPAGAVITDARFAEEAEWILDQGGSVFRIVRPGTVAVNGHASEAGLPDDLVTSTIHNDGSLEQLWSRVDTAIAEATPAERHTA